MVHGSSIFASCKAQQSSAKLKYYPVTRGGKIENKHWQSSTMRTRQCKLKAITIVSQCVCLPSYRKIPSVDICFVCPRKLPYSTRRSESPKKWNVKHCNLWSCPLWSTSNLPSTCPSFHPLTSYQLKIVGNKRCFKFEWEARLRKPCVANVAKVRQRQRSTGSSRTPG